MEEDPDMVSGGDEGRRDGRAAEPVGLLARRGCWAQHEPVQGALVGLLHVEVTEAARVERTAGVCQAGSMRPRTSREQSGLNSGKGWPAHPTPLLLSSPSLPDIPGSEGSSKENQDESEQRPSRQPCSSGRAFLAHTQHPHPTAKVEARQEPHHGQFPPLTLSQVGRPKVPIPLTLSLLGQTLHKPTDLCTVGEEHTREAGLPGAG